MNYGKKLRIGQRVCVPYFALPQFIFALSVQEGICWVVASEFSEANAVPISKVIPLD